MGDKHLFLPALSHALTLLTHTRSCQISEVKPHKRTPPHTGKAATATDLPLRPFVPGDEAPSIWDGCCLREHKTHRQHFADLQGRADLSDWS